MYCFDKILKIFAVVIVIKLASQPAWSQDSINSIHLTSQCEEQVAQYSLNTYEITGDMDVEVSQRGSIQFSISQVLFEAYHRGLIFRANGQEILHCVSPFVYEDFILVEEGVDYSLFQLDEFNTVRFYIHSKVNCGSNCYYSRVDTVAIPDNKDFPPIGYVELKSKNYEYPSRFFRAYLNEDEKHLLDNANR